MFIKGDAPAYVQKLDSNIRQTNTREWIRFVRLGSKTLRIECFHKEWTPLVEKQLAFTLKSNSDCYDATLVIWKETKIKQLSESLLDSHGKMRARIEKLVLHQDWIDVDIKGDDGSNISVFPTTGFVNAYDAKNNTYYYAAENLDPEEFIKQGHIFVQLFNKVIKSPTANLVHAAVVGLNGSGVLVCARGQRGKSTLAVLSMMQGFEYVSDDYLILEKQTNGKLLSSPIYSIVTLSPRMWNELYYEFDGKFVSNNARRDKYVFSISNYHKQFRENYAIKACIFPEIVSDKAPSIASCEKGRAITQLIHSTINQMGDKLDIATVRKLMNFVRDFNFYQINLSPDIYANVECLREFCNKLNKEKK